MLDPLSPDAVDPASDNDADGLTVLEEISHFTDLNDPDSDNDSIPDGLDLPPGRAPLVADWLVSAGGYFTCALDDVGVLCWGRNDYGQISVPALSHPTAVSAGLLHACALDNTGVVCWGAGMTNAGSSPEYGQSIVPVLSNPMAVSAGDYHTCALDDSGVVCWGDNSSGQNNVPILSNPVAVSGGLYHTCALDDSGVVCW